MKKMLSLAAMFAVLAYASPASAELKLSGDASMRLRGQFTSSDNNVSAEDKEDDLNFAYRLRLKAAADLGDGYFVKALLTTDNAASGWNTVGSDNGVTNASLDTTILNSNEPSIEISQLYFGRMQENCHYMVGRLPLNSVNNPIFDLTLYPFAPVDIPVATFNMDRVYGLNYGGKIGSGEANATLVVFDNSTRDDSSAEGDGLFNDGYALHLSYKDKLGDVTVEPQAIIGLTNLSGLDYSEVTPNTFGLNLSVPAGSAKIGMSAFYTVCDDEGFYTDGGAAANVDYSGYLLRLKAETGNFMAWVDYSQANDKTDNLDDDYSNLFVWAQYNFKVYESAAGSFNLTPTVRYWAAGSENNVTSSETDYSRLRTELVATVTF